MGDFGNQGIEKTIRGGEMKTILRVSLLSLGIGLMFTGLVMSIMGNIRGCGLIIFGGILFIFR